MRKIYALVLALVMILSFSACTQDTSVGVIGGADGPTEIIVSGENKELSDISSAILDHNEGIYAGGECRAEGHVILKEETVEGNKVVSLLASYGEYGFENGMFIKLSGSGAIPTRITFDYDGNVTEYKEAEDGEGYTESVKEMFDDEAYALYEEYSRENTAYPICIEQEHIYAKEYLGVIGREAKIGEYSDLTITLLTDLGVSVEVSNKMMEIKDEFINYFPYHLGSKEHVIDGVRYVFEKSYDDAAKEISFIQYEYGNEESTRKVVYDSVTGEIKEEV